MSTLMPAVATAFEARTSPVRLLVRALATFISIGVAGYGLIRQPWMADLRDLGWTLLRLDAVCAVVALPIVVWRMADRRLQVRIDHDGIWARKWGSEPISWANVARVGVRWRAFYGTLTVDLKDPLAAGPRLSMAEWISRRSLALFGFGRIFGDVCIEFGGLYPGLPAAVQYITGTLDRSVD